MVSERTPKIYGYCRASTKKQVESPETQKDHIKRYAGFNMPDGGDITFFVDASQSGKIAWQDRDAGKELFRQIRPGDHVIVSKLDRAFRRLADCVCVLEKFERMGIKLHIVNLMGGAIDLSSPMGRFMIHVLAAFAELERAFISERTKDGIARKKRLNQAHSRHPGYGFSWRSTKVDGKVVKLRVRNDEERNIMRSIVSWRMQEDPMDWDDIRQHLMYTLKLKTKTGGEWDKNRCIRACQAELKLQIIEGKARR